MALVASSIPNLVSGVSQQPAPSRLRTSGEEMVNAFPSIVSGLMKRPPSEWVAELSSTITIPDTASVHMIDRDADEKYILICGAGDLELYSIDGVKQTVTFPDGRAYLPTTDIWKKLRFATVADTTFIVNNEVVVQTTTPTETRDNPATIASVFVKRAVASTGYAIYVNGVLAGSTTTQDNTTAGTALEGTAEIAEELRANLVSNGYAAVRYGTVVSFPITAGATIALDDNFGGGAMKAYTDTIQDFAELPPSEAEGRLVKIVGDIEGGGEDYWVEYSNGVWTETYGHNAGLELAPATLPHILVKTGPGTFEFRRNVWEGRLAGDDESNPAPSFVGGKINSLFTFKGRMGFLTGENLVLSTVGNFERLFRSTVIQVLAEDVIDVASVTGRVNTLYHGVSFSDELVLFSDKQQFRLSSGQTLSAETVGITNSTTYPCSQDVTPVTLGSSAFFVANGPTHSVARELFLDSDLQTFNADDIAVQIPRYIPNGIRVIAASPSAEALVLKCGCVAPRLFVYKFYETNGKKVQSAWGRWEFNDVGNIVGIGFLDDYLYVVWKNDTQVWIERILLGPSIPQQLLLDHYVTQQNLASLTYDGVADETTLVLTTGLSGTYRWFRTDDNTGSEYEATKVNDTTYTIAGDITGQEFVGGLDYEFRYVFSTQYLREETPDGEASIQDGRLQLRYLSVIYTDSSYFEAHVTPTNGATSVYTFNGRVLSDPDNVTDLIPRDTGEFKFPVFAENEQVTIEIKSNEPYRVALGAVEWTADYRPRARRYR